MGQINYLAVIVAAASAFMLGGLWYSPAMLLNIWLKEDNRPDAFGDKKSHGPKAFALAYVASFIAALIPLRTVHALWIDSWTLALNGF